MTINGERRSVRWPAGAGVLIEVTAAIPTPTGPSVVRAGVEAATFRRPVPLGRSCEQVGRRSPKEAPGPERRPRARHAWSHACAGREDEPARPRNTGGQYVFPGLRTRHGRLG